MGITKWHHPISRKIRLSVEAYRSLSLIKEANINPSCISQHPPSENRGFPMADNISSCKLLILSAHPCAAGNAEYFSASLKNCDATACWIHKI
jgi:hypothetical protein